MSEFKSGQTVKYVGISSDEFTNGHKYEVGGKYHDQQDRLDPRVGILRDNDGVENGHSERHFEIVDDPSSAEATQEGGPVRTVTRKEIMPGTYGRIFIAADSPGHISLAFTSKATYTHDPLHEKSFNAPELRAAASVFLALAEALESQE